MATWKMNPLISEFKFNADKTLQFLKEDLKTIRTGRATPSLLENLQIEAYGESAKMNLSSLATIITENASGLLVTPFDPSIIQNIEKSILRSSLGLSPRVQGSMIHVSIPPLSEEQREKFVKLVGQKVEEKKNSIRGMRDEVRRKIKSQFENKMIAEDERFRLEKEIENVTHELMEEIQTIKDRKETEIRQV